MQNKHQQRSEVMQIWNGLDAFTHTMLVEHTLIYIYTIPIHI